MKDELVTMNGWKKNRIAWLVSLIILLLSVQSVNANKKTLAIIAAFSSPALSSEKFYNDMDHYLRTTGKKKFRTKLLIRGELGSDESHFYALRRGRVQIAGVGFQSISTAVPELTILNAPYLFNSWDELEYVYEKRVKKFINQLLARNGVIGLVHYGSTWHGIYSKQPIISPKNAKNKRFRALIDPSSQSFVKALQADIFQISGTDVVAALQTGLIEAGETNTHVYNITGTWTEAPYFTQTQHTASIISIIANRQWFEKLSVDQQKILISSHPPMLESGRALRADAARMLFQNSLKGVTIIKLDPANLSKWQSIGLSTHRRLVDDVGGRAQELYDLVQFTKREYQSMQ